VLSWSSSGAKRLTALVSTSTSIRCVVAGGGEWGEGEGEGGGPSRAGSCFCAVIHPDAVQRCAGEPHKHPWQSWSDRWTAWCRLRSVRHVLVVLDQHVLVALVLCLALLTAACVSAAAAGGLAVFVCCRVVGTCGH
jgi:hypothetical protein